MSVSVNSNVSHNISNATGMTKVNSKIDKNSLGFVNLVELAAKAKEKAEAEKSKKSYENILIAKVDLSQRFTPTGDPEKDRKLAAKYDYFDSCMDYTNVGDFDEITANEDFTGMTTAEKYKAIFEKYQHCYGENFLEAGAVRYWDSGVVKRFNSEIEEHCGAYFGSEIEKAHRELLYGNASKSEVRQKILEKYTEDGNLTVRNLFKAVNEMCLSGVADDGLGGIYDTVLDRIESNTDNVDEYYKEDHVGLLISKLDNYITANDCQKMLKKYQSRSNFQGASAEQGAVISQIIEACGGGYGSIRQMGISIEKMASSSERARANFTWIKI
ncbi:MAG: hypothetical protein K2K44_02805 [Oscillospiraceae bacterium]|nr:hypothetical protein [Oscillospiraceae bacterium]